MGAGRGGAFRQLGGHAGPAVVVSRSQLNNDWGRKKQMHTEEALL